MSDLPDWTTAQSNQGTVLFFGTKSAGSNFQTDVSNNQSLYIRFDGSLANTALIMQVQWFTDSTLSTQTQVQLFTCVPNPGGGNDLVIESPVYSSYAVITNMSTQIVTMTVIGTGRSVSNVRVLEDAFPGRSFTWTAAVTNGTPVTLTASDFGPSDFVSNGETTCVMSAAVAGTFVASFVNIGGAADVVFFGPVVANTQVILTLGLPKGGISFIFFPNANSAAPAITLHVSAAQL